MTDVETSQPATAHQMAYRRFRGHRTSVWCSCGWTIPNPTKLVTRAEIEQTWREHLNR